MMGLSTKEQERAIREATLVWHLRNNERASAEQIAERLEYGSVEALRGQLKNWGLPDWVLGEESETNRTKKKGRKKSAPLVRDLGPTKGLPPAGNATPSSRKDSKRCSRGPSCLNTWMKTYEVSILFAPT